jgi:hypothetical protein
MVNARKKPSRSDRLLAARQAFELRGVDAAAKNVGLRRLAREQLPSSSEVRS